MTGRGTSGIPHFKETAKRPDSTTSHLYGRIYETVGDIPSGRVATYGQIGRIVGCSPRVVGYAMAAAPSGREIPWHRVINSKGEISARKQGGGDASQRRRLEDEGLRFDGAGRLDLADVQWLGPAPGLERFPI